MIVEETPDAELVFCGELAATQRTLADLRAAASESLRLGLAGRQVGIRERTAAMLETALDAALQASGVGPAGMARARKVFRRGITIVRPEPDESRAITAADG